MVQESPAPADPEEFQDPLANYDPKKFDDPLEQALSEETVATIQHVPFESIPPETTVEQAVGKLAGLHIACLLVEREGQLLGVFSDRDVLDKVALAYDRLRNEPVAKVMTNDPIYVYGSDSAAAAVAVMVVAGFRHVPVLDVSGRLAGIVSPQRVTAFLSRHYQSDG